MGAEGAPQRVSTSCRSTSASPGNAYSPVPPMMAREMGGSGGVWLMAFPGRGLGMGREGVPTKRPGTPSVCESVTAVRPHYPPPIPAFVRLSKSKSAQLCAPLPAPDPRFIQRINRRQVPPLLVVIHAVTEYVGIRHLHAGEVRGESGHAPIVPLLAQHCDQHAARAFGEARVAQRGQRVAF